MDTRTEERRIEAIGGASQAAFNGPDVAEVLVMPPA